MTIPALRQFALLSVTALGLALPLPAQATERPPRAEAQTPAQPASEAGIAVANTVSVQMLETFAMGFINSSAGYLETIRTAGQREANLKRDAALAEIIPSYLAEWEAMLARGYEQRLSQDELKALMKPDTTVELKKKFADTHNEVMKEILPAAQPMLRKLAAEVDAKAFAKAAPKSPKGK